MDRARVWLAASPIIAAGVLSAHALAYRVTGTPAGPAHDYLDHVPQVLLVLAIVGLAASGLAGRLRMPPAWPFPCVAVATFVVQEHVERVAHTGELPWLLHSPAFLVGVLLQLPVALVAWALARRMLGALARPRVRARRLPRFLLRISEPATSDLEPVAPGPRCIRGPPLLLGP